MLDHLIIEEQQKQIKDLDKLKNGLLSSDFLDRGDSI